jgi:hypothetical protein
MYHLSVSTPGAGRTRDWVEFQYSGTEAALPLLASKSKAISHRKHAEPHAVVATHFLVEGANCPGIGVYHAWVDHPAVPKHVIDSDQSARPK